MREIERYIRDQWDEIALGEKVDHSAWRVVNGWRLRSTEMGP
jgi:hypothetical protein